MPDHRRVLWFVLTILFACASARAQRCGDCDLDGVVDVLDALRASQQGVGLGVLTAQGFSNCDIEPPGGDSDVDVLDSLVVARHSVGLTVSLSCPPLLRSWEPVDGLLPLMGHRMVFDSVRGVTVAWGGASCSGALTTLREWDGAG